MVAEVELVAELEVGAELQFRAWNLEMVGNKLEVPATQDKESKIGV